MEMTKESFASSIKAISDRLQEITIDENRELYNDLCSKYEEISSSDDPIEAEYRELKSQYLEREVDCYCTLKEAFQVPTSKFSHFYRDIWSGDFEQFLRSLYEDNEGSCCCADKSRYTTKKCIQALRTDTNLDLMPKGADVDDHYWLSDLLLTTDEAFEAYNVYKSLDQTMRKVSLSYISQNREK